MLSILLEPARSAVPISTGASRSREALDASPARQLRMIGAADAPVHGTYPTVEEYHKNKASQP